jgi:uncharacterized protein
VSEHQLPTRREALNLLVKAGCSHSVIEHCKLVSAFAVEIAKACQKKQHNVDVSLVEISSLLHDIGRSKTHSVDHALEGGKIARAFNLPESVALIIERHAGGGISKEEAKKLGWPVRDYLPTTLEEKIVCYADKRVEGTRIVPIKNTVKAYVEDLGENHPAIDRIWKLHREITALAGDFDANSDLA